MEIVTLVVEKMTEPLVKAVRREIGYLVKYDNNIENVDKEAEKLGRLKEWVQGQVDSARRNGEVIEADVRTWLENVDANTSGVRMLLEDKDKADKRCLGGWCINFCSRYRFSKEAKEKTVAITELHEEGCSKFQAVPHPAPLPGIEASSSAGFRTFETRASVMKQIREALMDKNIHIIGICGMRGVGKTTLVKEIGKSAKERALLL